MKWSVEQTAGTAWLEAGMELFLSVKVRVEIKYSFTQYLTHGEMSFCLFFLSSLGNIVQMFTCECEYIWLSLLLSNLFLRNCFFPFQPNRAHRLMWPTMSW